MCIRDSILVGGDGTYSESDLQAAIEAMDGRITSAAASGAVSYTHLDVYKRQILVLSARVELMVLLHN